VPNLCQWEDRMTDEEKFEAALEEAVFGCLNIGIHPAAMIAAMERKIADLKAMLAQLPS